MGYFEQWFFDPRSPIYSRGELESAFSVNAGVFLV